MRLYYYKVTLSFMGHVQNPCRDQNPPAFNIHPVKFENRLPIEGKG